FAAWFEDAKKAEPSDPDAMALATVDADGLPNVRMVLLKGFDERGFVFYSNEGSRKGGELAANPSASLAFHWKSLRRQIRLRGAVIRGGATGPCAYPTGRPPPPKSGVGGGRKSPPFESRSASEKALPLKPANFAVGRVPRPPFWIGYRLMPTVIEFWHERPFRLHDRIEFRRADIGAARTKTRLYP